MPVWLRGAVKALLLFGVALSASGASRQPTLYGLMIELSSGPPAERVVSPRKLLEKIIVPSTAFRAAVDRRVVLRELFQRVARGNSDQQRVEAWVMYVQDRVAHPSWPPMMD